MKKRFSFNGKIFMYKRMEYTHSHSYNVCTYVYLSGKTFDRLIVIINNFTERRQIKREIYMYK